MRTPSAIAAELEAAFVAGKSERDLLVLIRQLRAAIDSKPSIDMTIDSQSFEAHQNQYYANNLRQ